MKNLFFSYQSVTLIVIVKADAEGEKVQRCLWA